MPKKTVREVLFIKELIHKGYTDKQIRMVTQATQSYINKLRNGKLQRDNSYSSDEPVEMTEQEARMLATLNKIITLPEIFTSGTSDQDLIYIQVLKFFGVKKEDVFNLYFHLPKKQLNGYWLKKVDIRQFKSELIGIKYRDYIELIFDYFYSF